MVKYSGSQRDRLDATFSALADPTRRAMIAALSQHPATVSELAQPHSISLPAVMKHLRILEQAGLVSQHKAGRVRHCRLTAQTMKQAADWISQYRIFWEGQFDSLDRYLSQPAARFSTEATANGGLAMPQTQTIAPVELIVNRTFRAPIEKVFHAWTDPSEIDRWFSPSDDMTVSSSVDFRVGGSYRIDMHKPDGAVFSVSGKYLEIQPPHLLSFTWRGACDFEPNETLVTIEFFSLGDNTQITLTHQNFSSDDSRQRHEHGWTGCLDRLAKIL